MKNRLLCVGLFMIASLSIISYPAYRQYDGFQRDPESGIYYRFYAENKETARTQDGDLMNFVYTLCSKDEFPLQFKLGAGMVISDFEEGILSMREDGKAILIIPSSLAYGDRGIGQTIPPYTHIVSGWVG